MVSRFWDVWAFANLIPEEVVIYADSDILWVKDPLPLSNDPVLNFCGEIRGDGFFYFRARSLGSEVFLNTVRSMTLGGILSDELRTKMRISGYHTPMFLAEMPYRYLVRNGMTRGWSPIDLLENYFLDDPADPVEPLARNYHCHSGQFGSGRLRGARKVIEFNEAIRKALHEKYANMLVGGGERGNALSSRIADLCGNPGNPQPR